MNAETEIASEPAEKFLAGELRRALEHQMAGRYADAGSLLDTLISDHGERSKFLHYKGLNLILTGKRSEGETLLRKALDLDPEDPVQLTDLGSHLAKTGDLDHAVSTLQNAVDLAPNYSIAQGNLGAILVLKKEFSRARQHLEKAIELDPNLLDAHTNLGLVLLQSGNHARAVETFFRALAIDPQSTVTHVNLSGALYHLERHEAAEHHARRALEIEPTAWKAYLHLGQTLASAGRIDEAKEALRRICNRPPYAVAALSQLIRLQRVEESSPEFGLLQRALERIDDFGEEQKATLHFASGKAFDDLENFDQAFAHLRKANEISSKSHPFDSAKFSTQSTRIRQMVDAPFLSRLSGSGVQDVSPIFITGLPRSGTTLVEQMFSRHSAVHAGGELRAFAQALGKSDKIRAALEERLDPDKVVADDFDRLGEYYVSSVRSEGIRSAKFTDKMPANYQYAGLIALAVPKAKIIVMRRHPLDCLLSNYFQNFGRNQPFSNCFDGLATVYEEFARMVDHWKSLMPGRLLEVHYESVVEDPKLEMRRALEFCGLDWEPAVLDHVGSSHRVNTASIAQIREPLYQTAKSRWLNYTPHIEPLVERLGKHVCIGV